MTKGTEEQNNERCLFPCNAGHAARLSRRHGTRGRQGAVGREGGCGEGRGDVGREGELWGDKGCCR